MTATLPAPLEAPAAPQAPRLARVALAGALAAGWTLLGVFAVVAAFVLLAWLGEGAAQPLPDVLAVAAAGLLLGAGATLTAGGVAWGLAPLGLVLVVGVLAARAASWAVDWADVRGRTPNALLVASATVTSGLLGAAAAAAASVLAVTVEPGDAAARVGLLVGAGAVVGVLRECRARRGDVPLPSATDWPSRVAAGVLAAGGVLLSGAAAVTTLSLVLSGSAVATLVGQINPGLAGAVALLAAAVLYLPTLIVWTFAVLVGPGVQIGTQVAVSAGGVAGGPLPGFPLLGAVPAALPAWFVAVGPLLLLAAGAAAGVLLARHRDSDPSVRHATLGGAATGLGVGLAAGAACWLASGPMGPGDWAWAGPAPAPVAGLVALVVGSVTTLVLLGALLRDRRAGEQS